MELKKLIAEGRAELARRKFERAREDIREKNRAEWRAELRRRKLWQHLLAEASVDLACVYEYVDKDLKPTWQPQDREWLRVVVPGLSMVVAEYDYNKKTGEFALAGFCVSRHQPGNPSKTFWEQVPLDPPLDRDTHGAIGVALALASDSYLPPAAALDGIATLAPAEVAALSFLARNVANLASPAAAGSPLAALQARSGRLIDGLSGDARGVGLALVGQVPVEELDAPGPAVVKAIRDWAAAQPRASVEGGLRDLDALQADSDVDTYDPKAPLAA